MLIDLTPENLTDINEALAVAIDDARHYFAFGCPDLDYKGAERDLQAYRDKVKRWEALYDALST